MEKLLALLAIGSLSLLGYAMRARRREDRDLRYRAAERDHYWKLRAQESELRYRVETRSGIQREIDEMELLGVLDELIVVDGPDSDFAHMRDEIVTRQSTATRH